jgi:hypothetical protein
MKTLSTIILEETIKSALIVEQTKQEPDLSQYKVDTGNNTTVKIGGGNTGGGNTGGGNTGGDKTNTTTKPKPSSFDGTKIADLIIGSTSWYNDREDDLIAAIKQIKNVTEFWAVNKKIVEKTGKTFSGFIFDKILDEDEWDTIYPIIKHLATVIPQSQWGTSSQAGPLYNFLKKTTGANEDLKSRDASLYNKFKNAGTLGTVRHSEDLMTTLKDYGLIGLGALTLMMIICMVATGSVRQPFCGVISKWLQNRNKTPDDLINEINLINKIFGGYARRNKKEISRVLYEMEADDVINEEELNILLKTLKTLSVSDLRKAKISIILKRFKQIGKIQSGDAKLVLQGVRDIKAREELRPYLQAYEDFNLGKDVKKITKTEPELKPGIDKKLLVRNINASTVTKYPKTSVSIKDIRKMYEIHKLNNPQSSAYSFGTPGAEQIDKIIEIYEIGLANQFRDANQIKIWKSTRDKWLAAQKIVLGGRDGNIKQVLEKQSGDLKILNQFISDMKTGKVSIPQYYLKSPEFPSWKQWMYDNKIKGGGNDKEWQKFLTQRFIWDKLNAGAGGSQTNYYYTTTPK